MIAQKHLSHRKSTKKSNWYAILKINYFLLKTFSAYTFYTVQYELFSGATALWWAEFKGHTELADFLRSKGATK